MKSSINVRARRSNLAGASIAIFAIATSFSVSAMAQEGSQEDLAEAASSSNRPEDIVVTGSRIGRRDFNSSSPITTIDSGQIARSGDVTIEQTLNQLPQLQANNTSNVNAAGGSGTLTADLRGLGSSRTLVLVNNRRFAPADTSGVVDLASIPQSLISKVEVVTGGASAVYGSDAIGGVVNFILKDDFEGVTASYGFGVTERGDGEAHTFDLTVGGNFADGRGNVTLFGAYSKQKPVFQADRSFSAVSLFEGDGGLVPGGSSRVPGSVVFGDDLIYPDGRPAASCSAPIGAQFRENGTPTPFCLTEDAYNFAAPNYLMRPRERWQLAATAHYDLTDDIKWFGEAFYMNTVNNLQQAPGAVDFEDSPGTRTLSVPLNNPLLPNSVRNFLAANFDGDNDGIATLVGARRRFDETGPRKQIYDRDTFQIVTGLKGSLNDFRWELFYQYGKSSTDEQFVNQVSNLRIAQGLDVIAGANGPECRNSSFGCVPVNIFGFGSITPQAVNFLTPTAFTKTTVQRQVMGGNIAGDVFELPAGPVGAALGFEYRKESANYRPDATVASGELGSGIDGLPLAGSFDVFELFGETRVPILSETPFFHYLGLEAAARYSDYSTVGAVWTFKAGGEWAPIEDIRVRALFQRAVRAPNLIELYQGRSSGSQAYADPCDFRRAPSANVRTFCVGQGVPTSSINTFQQDDVVNTITGGNAALRQEKSDTITLGVVVQPRGIPGLSASLDYYKIKVDNAIDTISPQTIINLCFNKLDLADPSCQRIRRLSNGRISAVESFNANIATFKVDGLDAAVTYRFGLPDSVAMADGEASLTTRLLASWQFKREKQSSPGVAPTDCAGKFGGGICSGQGIPIVLGFKALAGIDYESGPVNVGIQGRYLGKSKPIDAGNVITAIKPRFYMDLTASLKISEHIEVNAAVDNLLGTKPPILGFNNGGDTNTDPAVFDVLGRRYFLRTTIKF